MTQLSKLLETLRATSHCDSCAFDFLTGPVGGLTAEQIDALSDEHQRRIVKSLVSRISVTLSQSVGKHSVSGEFRADFSGLVESDGSGHDQRPCGVAREQQLRGGSASSAVEDDHGKKQRGGLVLG